MRSQQKVCIKSGGKKFEVLTLRNTNIYVMSKGVESRNGKIGERMSPSLRGWIHTYGLWILRVAMVT